jgi:hypothetical protein
MAISYRVELLAVATTLVICFVVGGFAIRHYTKQPYQCVAGVDEVCPTKQFYDDYKHYQHLQEDIVNKQQESEFKIFQEEMDQSTGLAIRLSNDIKATIQQNPGTTWDEKRMKFVKSEKSLPETTK